MIILFLCPVLGDDDLQTIEANVTNCSAATVPDPLPLIAEEPSSFWTFNESADVSKYENFDQSKFIGREMFLMTFEYCIL